jgi:hypothetical protein
VPTGFRVTARIIAAPRGSIPRFMLV